MIKIYHNPRCSKSREGLELLKNSGEDFETVEYLKDSVSEKQLSEVLQKLKMRPDEIIRKNEKIWKENFKGKEFTDSELIKIMVENPILIERPIVVKNDKAVVGRPASNISDLIK